MDRGSEENIDESASVLLDHSRVSAFLPSAIAVVKYLILLERLCVATSHYIRLPKARVAWFRARPPAALYIRLINLRPLKMRLPRYIRLHNRWPTAVLLILIRHRHCQLLSIIITTTKRFHPEVSDLRFDVYLNVRVDVRRVVHMMLHLRRRNLDLSNRIVPISLVHSIIRVQRLQVLRLLYYLLIFAGIVAALFEQYLLVSELNFVQDLRDLDAEAVLVLLGQQFHAKVFWVPARISAVMDLDSPLDLLKLRPWVLNELIECLIFILKRGFGVRQRKQAAIKRVLHDPFALPLLALNDDVLVAIYHFEVARRVRSFFFYVFGLSFINIRITLLVHHQTLLLFLQLLLAMSDHRVWGRVLPDEAVLLPVEYSFSVSRLACLHLGRLLRLSFLSLHALLSTDYLELIFSIGVTRAGQVVPTHVFEQVVNAIVQGRLPLRRAVLQSRLRIPLIKYAIFLNAKSITILLQLFFSRKEKLINLPFFHLLAQKPKVVLVIRLLIDERLLWLMRLFPLPLIQAWLLELYLVGQISLAIVKRDHAVG